MDLKEPNRLNRIAAMYIDRIGNVDSKWLIFCVQNIIPTPGSVTNLYDKTTGDYVTHDYDKGADQGKVIINKNGTYSMTHAAWAKGKTAEGKWRLSFPAEINGERIQAIVLLNGLTSVDWAVAPSDNGKIRLLYAMRWTDGSTTWVFDSELYKN
ncbi:MAG: hypothetical protein PHC44_05780 [Lutispora sp.]|nr:hypothetical protein [Lutispora sp.]MDD4834224.1 hypothetical protein [Lutispora sp.]